MNRAPEHVVFSECMVGISVPSLKTCKSRLPLGMMPILNRVTGIFPAGNQHFLMPFGADHAHTAGLNSFQSVPAFYRD